MGYFRGHMLKVFTLAVFAFLFAGCQTASFEVVVKTSDGALINNAKVHLDDRKTITTDKKGVASISVRVSQQNQMVIRAEKEGFITQSILIPIERRQTEVKAQLILKPASKSMQIANIQDAQTIESDELGAKVILPQNALVKPNGEVAQGEVTLYLTPWDITGDDLLAMPGNGEAIDANGERTSLISAGMMSVDFYDTNGNYLQLAPGATATIQMDLMRESVNNIPLNPGSQIPMWHFDEEKGLWVEDGTGNVIAANDTPLGMAVIAEVTHFSTWNWDFKWENGGSVDVQCRLYDGTPTPCNIVAKVTLDDGSNFTKSRHIPTEGATIINMPTNAAIEWTGTTATGLMGHETSGSFGTVVITVEEPTTDNFVQCQLPNGSFTACSATLENPNGVDLKFSIPAEGATIQTALQVLSPSWSAKTRQIIEDNEVVIYTGIKNSNAKDNVVILLDNREILGDAATSIRVKCTNPNNFPIETYDVTGYILLDSNNTMTQFFYQSSIPIDKEVTIPISGELGRYYFHCYARKYNDVWLYDGWKSRIPYTDLIDNQLIEIPLLGNLPAEEVPPS